MESIFIYFRRFVSGPCSAEQLRQGQLGVWCRDPLSHPDIQSMSERERADLQFDPRQIRSE